MQRGTIQGQIFLDTCNPILENALRPRLLEGKREPCELKVSDFDDTMYTLEVLPDRPSTISLSVYMCGWKEISSNGGSDLLAVAYPGMVSPQTLPGHSVTLTIDVDNPPMAPEELLKRLAELKRNLLAAPFDRALGAMREGHERSLPVVALPWRKNEVVYIVPQGYDPVVRCTHLLLTLCHEASIRSNPIWYSSMKFGEIEGEERSAKAWWGLVGAYLSVKELDSKYPFSAHADRTTIIYAIDFPEADERAIAKTFLMEFVDAQRVANNSPPCTFKPDPPLELRSMPGPAGLRPIGYLSLVIFPQHIDRGRQEKTVTLITGLRNYLHYHLKATKTYMHMRMRKRVVGLLQVLNRAIPEEEAKIKKTAQGRAFNRG